MRVIDALRPRAKMDSRALIVICRGHWGIDSPLWRARVVVVSMIIVTLKRQAITSQSHSVHRRERMRMLPSRLAPIPVKKELFC